MRGEDVKIKEMLVTRAKKAAYSVLICAAAACLGAALTSIWGPPAGLALLGVIACAAPLGRTVWP